MKKFGTPIGAGPGNANGKFGFAVEGPRRERRRDFGLEALGVLAVGRWPPLPFRFPLPWLGWLWERLLFGFEPELFDGPPWWCEGVGCAFAGVVVRGGGGERVVEGGPLKVVVVPVVEAHASDIAKIGCLTGSDNADSGVPAGTFTV